MAVTPEKTSSRVRRRRRKHTKVGVFVCAILCSALVFFAKPAVVSWEAKSIRTAPALIPPAKDVAPHPETITARRVVYPHSVIPGGVQNRSELARETNQDPVVAAHYADFKTEEARVVRVEQEKLVHVSYRLNEKIFWTARQVKLPKGETLITDGRSFARTRCGNRVAVLPQEPTSTEEPPSEAFDIPIPLEEPELPTLDIPDLGDPLLRFEFALPPLPPLPIPVNLVELPGPREWPLRYTIPVIVPPVTPFIVTPPDSFIDVPGIPEPNTLLLLGSGVAVLLLARRSWKRY